MSTVRKLLDELTVIVKDHDNLSRDLDHLQGSLVSKNVELDKLNELLKKYKMMLWAAARGSKGFTLRINRDEMELLEPKMMILDEWFEEATYETCVKAKVKD